MFGFASPSWLAALAVLALPIALHLWSRKPSRTVRIGSLRHLEGPPGPRAWGRRLDQVPTLLLRMCVLGTIVLGLAGLRWNRSGPPPVPAAAVYLVEPALLADSLALFGDPLVDSLRRRGIQLHVLAQGMPTLDRYNPALDSTSPAATWSRLVELDSALPRETPLTVIGRARAGGLGAARPAMARSVNWHELAAPPGLPVVLGSWPGRGDTVIRLLEHRSGATARRFLLAQPHRAIAAPGSLPPPHFAGSIVIVGVTAEFEVRAVRSAFLAAATRLWGLAPDLEVQGPERTIDPANLPGWIVWLAPAPVSASVAAAVNGGARLLEFPSPKASRPIESGVTAVGTAAVPRSLGDLRLFQRSQRPSGAPILLDWNGDPVLTMQRIGKGLHYRLATRVDPAWSDLALTPALPELAVLLLRQSASPDFDAPVSASQAVPMFQAAGSQLASRRHPLRNPALCLAGALLLIERLLAQRRRSPA